MKKTGKKKKRQVEKNTDSVGCNSCSWNCGSGRSWYLEKSRDFQRRTGSINGKGERVAKKLLLQGPLPMKEKNIAIMSI